MKTNNHFTTIFNVTFKKALSVLLIGSQISMASASFASESKTPTPEVAMLGKVLALQGQTLSDQERQSELSQILKDYTATATEDGVQARLEDALVQLQVFTPAQAEQFVNDSQASGQKALDAATPDQLSANLASQIMQVSQLYPQGAQFSACSALLHTGGWTVGLGFATMLASIFVISAEHCPPGTDAGSPPSRGFSFGGTVSCSAEPVKSHPELGLGMAIGSGVAVVVGFLLLFRSDSYCTN